MADDSSGNLAETEDEKEFQIREQVRLRMEAQLQDELKKIKEKVSLTFRFMFHSNELW